MNEPSRKSLDELSAESDPGIVSEFIDFLKYNKKWWLLPILIVMGLVGLIALLPAGATPFIYTLF